MIYRSINKPFVDLIWAVVTSGVIAWLHHKLVNCLHSDLADDYPPLSAHPQPRLSDPAENIIYHQLLCTQMSGGSFSLCPMVSWYCLDALLCRD